MQQGSAKGRKTRGKETSERARETLRERETRQRDKQTRQRERGEKDTRTQIAIKTPPSPTATPTAASTGRAWHISTIVEKPVPIRVTSRTKADSPGTIVLLFESRDSGGWRVTGDLFKVTCLRDTKVLPSSKEAS
eukprot:894296-Amorphochlora_amoeboformis.AAC.1